MDLLKTAASRSYHPETRIDSSRAHDWLVWLPALAALALFAPLNQNFGFDSPGWLDPFMYLGYFWHYPEHLSLLENDYKASRLPWVLPGFAAHRLLGEIAGSYLLHWFTLTVGGTALYLLMRSTLRDRAVAAITALAWVSSTSAHGVGGWNYHIVAAAAYYLLACWLVVREDGRGVWRPAIALAGAAFAAAVHTHLFLALFAPFVAWLYLVARARAGPASWRRLALDAARFATGAAGLTLILMAINGVSGGNWLFFMRQIDYAIWMSQPGHDRWYFEMGRWLPTAKYLVIPVLCLVAGTLALRQSSGGEAWRFSAALVLQGWSAMLVVAYCQFVRHQSVMDHDYMAFVIQCHTFPAFGVALLGPARSDRSVREASSAVALAGIVILGALLFGMPTVIPRSLERMQLLFGSVPAIVPPLVVGLVVVLIATPLRRGVRMVAWAVWFSVLNVWVAPAPSAYGLGTPGIQRSMLTLFREADQFTARLDPSLSDIKYWFVHEVVPTRQGAVDLAAVFDSYVSVHSWLANLLAQEAGRAGVDQILPTQLERVTCIGVLSSIAQHHHLVSELHSRLSTYEVILHDVGSRRFEAPELSFELTVFRVGQANSPSAAGSAGAPPCSSTNTATR
jgi:hypothetical protein